MLNNKEILRDDNNKIRPCAFNYVRMNTFELMYCRLFIWKTISKNIKCSFLEMIENFKEFIIRLIDLCLIPISFIFMFPVACYKDIKQAKETVLKDFCFECKYYEGNPFKNKGNSKGTCENCKLINGKALNFEVIQKGEK